MTQTVKNIKIGERVIPFTEYGRKRPVSFYELVRNNILPEDEDHAYIKRYIRKNRFH